MSPRFLPALSAHRTANHIDAPLTSCRLCTENTYDWPAVIGLARGRATTTSLPGTAVVAPSPTTPTDRYLVPNGVAIVLDVPSDAVTPSRVTTRYPAVLTSREGFVHRFWRKVCAGKLLNPP